MFGGVYLWAAGALAIGAVGLAVWMPPAADRRPSIRVLDYSLVGVLTAIAIQLIPLPTGLVSLLEPARASYARATTLVGDPRAVSTLSLETSATIHAWLAAFCGITTYWIARELFRRGGIRIVVTGIAWISVAFVLVAVAQASANTNLVYGFWQPYDAGARPLGPFVNRNHGGTWSLIALMLCFGCFQWRRARSSSTRASTWRHRLAETLNGRRAILMLAVVLLILNIALGASRSTIAALLVAAGYMALWAPKDIDRRGAWLRIGLLAVVVSVALAAYADLDLLLSRVDQTRRLGLSARTAIWRDTLAIVRDFPLTGVGAGNFSNAMRLYQTSERTYFWNDAHNEYLQIAAEGGVLLGVPVSIAIVAVVIAAARQLRRQDDPMAWMRLGAAAALLAVAVQAIWETGLALPANSMLASVAIAILLHEPRQPRTSRP